MSALVCPYCYLDFAEKEILFRCTGLLGPGGRKCEVKRDPVLFERFGLQEALPPTFAAKGRRGDAVCVECSSRTARRVCPRCHSQLPVHFGKIDNRLVAMIGAKESGKTVYMTVLLHELMHGIGRRFDAAVQGSDDHTRRQFTDRFEHDLYGARRLPGTTRSAATEHRLPLVFRVSLTKRRLAREAIRHTLMSFFDTAGEDLTSVESVELNTRYLRSASGVILLLDPLQMAGARELAATGVPMPGHGPGFDTPFNVLSRVTELLQTATRTGPGKKLAIPMAVAFSKIDALWDTFEPGSPLLQSAPDRRPALDLDDREAVHEHVRALLHEWDGGQIDQLLRANYRSYGFFGLSALGEPPRDGKIAESGIRPHRVEDPFLWLLSQFKVIPTQGS
ncbi:TRAFAC clade GTPase domain-containing protein [Thermomonospora umbrina]|uniref:Double-GTPase 2 domain-containing protein n=1 Tax=Thermomonospora umbrina TaxID=111806 RepID=A0A3D9SRU5_9ACTN|nr:hypothetical protein [Thermomonospora umbrina]REE97200.1 hypothetical protein DFJ69_2662 [Thermomonospora umbrina]